jgi:putative ATP-binding cassette transporter
LSKQEPKRTKNFDRRLWRRFWNIAKPYWFLDEKWTARGLLALLILLLLGRTEFTVLFNQQSGEFTSATIFETESVCPGGVGSLTTS